MTDFEVDDDIMAVYLPISDFRLDAMEKKICEISREKQKFALQCFERIKVLNRRLIAKLKQHAAIIKKTLTNEDVERLLSNSGQEVILYSERGIYKCVLTRRVVKYDLRIND